MNPNKTSNLDDILNLEPLDTEDTNTTPSAASPDTLVSNHTPQAKKSWSENVNKRLVLTGLIAGIPALLFVLIFGSMFELKKALDKNKPESIETASIEITAEPKIVEENLRGINAVNTQLQGIKSIEERKLEPQPKIKLERTKPVVEVEKVPSIPATSRPVSQPTPVVRRQVSNPVSKIATKPATPKPQYDSMSDWNQLALVGSYGGGQKQNNSISAPIKSVGARLNNNYSATLVSNVTISTKQGDTLISLSESEASFLKTISQSEPIPAAPSVTQDGMAIAIAQQVKGKTISALNWPEGVKNQPQRSFIRLEEPLYDRQDEIAIDEGAVIVFEVSQIEGGIVLGRATEIIDGNKERQIPAGAISVLSKKGEMLTAKFKQIKNGSGNADLLNFALGAAQETNNLVSRPNSSFSQISSFGQSQGANYDNKNYPASALSGGATEVIEKRTEELERQRNNIPISSFWQLKKGTTVLIQIDNSFNY